MLTKSLRSGYIIEKAIKGLRHKKGLPGKLFYDTINLVLLVEQSHVLT
jgi:hypothetical protein